MGINISVEEVAIFESFRVKVSEQDVILLQAGIKPDEQDVKIREFLDINRAQQSQYMSNLIKDKNEIKQLQEQVESGYYESKEHYEELGESDCVSITKNEDSDDESMADSLNDRFRNLAIPPSMKALGKTPERRESIGMTVAKLQDANKIMMTNHGRKYKYVKLYKLNQTIGHTRILMKNIPKHVTKEMLVEAIRENMGNPGELNYKIKEEMINVETEVEVQILDKKFKGLWSIPCNRKYNERRFNNNNNRGSFQERLQNRDNHREARPDFKDRRQFFGQEQTVYQLTYKEQSIDQDSKMTTIKDRVIETDIWVTEDITTAVAPDTMEERIEESTVALGATKNFNKTNKNRKDDRGKEKIKEIDEEESIEILIKKYKKIKYNKR
ncbi:hypothetical protein C1645_832934 [Glomus cerebriforme]|uniref:Uncharacterized protein n=1 Tax=Glomus cerebriforme TaxID=658196 RepID=A0A397SJ43_9GLOM|nr:hypothetical protein C1645_832934 [Glomus cerebriforme]